MYPKTYFDNLDDHPMHKVMRYICNPVGFRARDIAVVRLGAVHPPQIRKTALAQSLLDMATLKKICGREDY